MEDANDRMMMKMRLCRHKRMRSRCKTSREQKRERRRCERAMSEKIAVKMAITQPSVFWCCGHIKNGSSSKTEKWWSRLLVREEKKSIGKYEMQKAKCVCKLMNRLVETDDGRTKQDKSWNEIGLLKKRKMEREKEMDASERKHVWWSRWVDVMG